MILMFELVKREKTLEEKLLEKLNEIPELYDVLNKLLELNIAENRQIKVEISVKDFENMSNSTYEKIIKRA